MDSFAELVALAELVGPAHQNLLDRARAVGAGAGIEVVELRPAGDSLWDLRIRMPALRTHKRRDGAGAEPAQPTRVSPIRTVIPFCGDGTDDLARFLEEADPRSAVAPNGIVGEWFADITTRQRLEMLARAMVGDALLSIQHQGLAGDSSARDVALRTARDQFSAEVDRTAAHHDRGDLMTVFDTAAVELAPLLQQTEG